MEALFENHKWPIIGAGAAVVLLVVVVVAKLCCRPAGGKDLDEAEWMDVETGMYHDDVTPRSTTAGV